MFVLRVSLFITFLLRALSSIWLYTYAAGYGYSSWAMRYGGREKQSHRAHFQNRAQHAKPDIHAQVNTTPRHSFGKRFSE